MAFTDLDNTAPAKSDVPAAGVVVGTRAAGRGDKKTRYIAMLIGKDTATAINFHLGTQNVAVRIGSGTDEGKLAVVVDQKGKFQAKRQKSGHYLLTINAAAAGTAGFRLEFDRFTIDKARIVPGTSGQPAMLIITIPSTMKAA